MPTTRERPQDDGAHRAEEIMAAVTHRLDRFAEAEEEVQPAVKFPARAKGIYLADVQHAVHRFETQLRFLKRVEELFPCVKTPDGESIPVDIDLPLYAVRHLPDWPLRNFLELLGKRFEGDHKFSVVAAPLVDAISFFRIGLMKFLPPRLMATKASPSFPVLFEAHTKKEGHRVHYTNCFFVDTCNVFGSNVFDWPKPVTEFIKPGRYMFGIWDTAKGDVDLDPAKISVPPLTWTRIEK